MKQLIRDYFTFNKRERNGIFVLISIIFLMIVYLNVSSLFYKKQSVDFSSFNRFVSKWEELDSMSVQSSDTKGNVFEKSEKFFFNPNDLAVKDWKRLGLSEKQIRTIKNYESKGGSFKSKKDFKKMYGISSELYNSLESFISIQPQVKPLVSEKKIKNTQLQLMELNTTDSAQLTTIKGIGPFYAKSIIKYRNQLGGFIKKEQLLELWKFDQEKYNGIEKFITVDSSKVKKININICKAEELKHPYLTWNMANAIVNYRNSHGKFKTIEDIQKTDLVDEQTLRKIAAYLVVE